jgi:hypothetical protein
MSRLVEVYVRVGGTETHFHEYKLCHMPEDNNRCVNVKRHFRIKFVKLCLYLNKHHDMTCRGVEI